ncbi:MAG TPA: DUF2130 domain-containing protein [Chitinophagaceae bacterium]|nr:DUF2130 domain-containing protein [Chitinophagaceae bacterium]
MPTLIICPNCKNEFAPEDAIAKVLEKQFEIKLNSERENLSRQYSVQQLELEKQQKEFEEKKKKANDLFAERLQVERLKLETELQEQLRKSISSDFENKLRLLEQNNKDNEEKLKSARKKELDFLQKEQQLKNKENELDLNMQRQLQQEREKIGEEIKKSEQQKNLAKETEYLFKLRELEKQRDDQKKLVEEMKRKAEQGSMQLQGEVQEQALEDMLKNAFPFDLITEVAKGRRGADCIQTVRNNFGQECGHIIYESKRTQNFSGEWIEKLKTDMRTEKADIAVIVTNRMPKDMDCFGLKDGVWICCFDEVKALAGVLRDGVMRVYSSAKSHENKGDKINMLYSYLTSNEFTEKWKAMREGFLSIAQSIQKEKDVMEKLWAARKKQLEKILYNSNDIKGSIDGISGHDTIDFNLMENNDDNLLEN